MEQFVLEILDGDRAGRVIPLQEGRIRIGRRSHNDVVLSDEKVSGEHAEVVHEEGRYVLRDLESTNGTLLEGRRIVEVALTSRDTFQVGRIRISFHRDGEEAESDLRLHRVSSAALNRTSRSPLPLIGLLVLLGLAGGVLYYNLDDGAAPGPGAPLRRVVSVVGNRIPQEAADCEAGAGWELDIAGDGFEYGGPAHSGVRALEARAVPGGVGYALARLAEPVKVRDSLQLSAYLRTAGRARLGLRVRFSSSVDPEALEFVTGIPPVARAGVDYQRVEWEAAVPPTMDLAAVELLALVPEDGDVAWADDLAILEAGSARAIDLRAGGRVFGTGSSLQVSLIGGGPLVLGLRPARLEPALQTVADAGWLTLAEAGRRLSVSAEDPRVRIAIEGGPGVILDLPAETSGSVLYRAGSGPFARLEAAVEADQVLIGSNSGRALLTLPSIQAVRIAAGDGVARLHLPAADGLGLRMAFAAERDLAREELELAREAAARPGAALARVQKVLDEYPHDVGRVREARELYAELVRERARRIEQLRVELETAAFFRTRGGFARVRDGLDRLVRDYGEHLDRPEQVAAMRRTADDAMRELDRRTAEARIGRLRTLVEILEAGDQEDLAGMVRDYLARQEGR